MGRCQVLVREAGDRQAQGRGAGEAGAQAVGAPTREAKSTRSLQVPRHVHSRLELSARRVMLHVI